MAFPFWLTGSRINSKIISKEDKAKMNWPLSNAHLLSYTLHGLHSIFICTTMIHVFFYRFMSFLHLLLWLSFILNFLLIIYYSSFRNWSVFSTVRPSLNLLELIVPLLFVLPILVLVCFLQLYRNSPSMVPETNSGDLQDQKHAHNNPTKLLYLSLPFSQECIFEVSWEYMTSDT